ncbi:TPA: accessory Sec system protein Asp1, partial [Streptococcus agalactiae]|nr:accessory Sec system protein Asp1 [Streptococcus agalactiae]
RILVLKKLEVTPDDYIIVAVNDIHNNLVRKSFPDQKKIFSFFGERYSFDNRLDFNELLDEGELFIAESEKIERLLITSLQEKNYSSNYVENHISRIPPFDTRLRLGQSQNIEELIAYLLVDDLSQTYLSEVLDQLLAKMEVNPSLE